LCWLVVVWLVLVLGVVTFWCPWLWSWLSLASIAVKAGGSGDVSKSQVLWRQRVEVSYSSPVVVGDQLCWIDGVVQGLQTSDGKSVAKERLYDSRGEFVSAVAVGAKVIALTRFNGLYVLDGAGQFAKLAHLAFEGDDSPFKASPAVSNGRLYVRSNAYLYCVGKKS
jgi:outer membrane protein assembly factor BamB